MNQERLKQAILYDPDTGEFRSLENRGKIKTGQALGKTKGNRYPRIGIDGERYYAHRLAFMYMRGRWPKEIDHINHNKSDNRWRNLREVDHYQNTVNQRRASSNTSGETGVNWDKWSGKWRAAIMVKGEYITIGRYKSKDAALNARREAERVYGFHSNHGRAHV